MRKVIAVAVALVLAGGLSWAQRVDIFSALRAGTVTAEFRGNGDASVIGVITRLPGGPTEVVIPAGSVFRVASAGRGAGWNQFGRGYGGYGGRGGYGGYGGYGGRGGRYGQGGRQGMFGMRSTTTRLAFANTAEVVIPAVCMDYNKPAPTRNDVMVILPPPPNLKRLAAVVDQGGYSHPAVQLAMWALVNRVPRRVGERYLQSIIPGRSKAIEQQRMELMDLARALLQAAEFDPAALPMFK